MLQALGCDSSSDTLCQLVIVTVTCDSDSDMPVAPRVLGSTGRSLPLVEHNEQTLASKAR
jgi:hypothetical protein